MRRFKSKKEKGQGMTEYLIIVVLIALSSIAIVGFFGDSIRGLWVGATDKINKDDTTQEDVDFSGEVDKKGQINDIR